MVDNFNESYFLNNRFSHSCVWLSSILYMHLTHFMPRSLSISPENIKNLSFSDVFWGYRKRQVAWNGLKMFDRVVSAPISNSHSQMFYKTGVLKNIAKSTVKHLCQSLFLNKVKGLRRTTLFIKRLRNRWFPMNFATFF